MIGIERIDDIVRLREFLPEWSRFLQAVPPATPFQRPDWLLPWWLHFGSGALHVLVFRDGSNTAGVLPCFRHEWRSRQQLTLLGAGLSDYLDPVFNRRHSPAIIDALESHLRNGAEWEICDWQDLSAGTPLAALGSIVPDTLCSRIPLVPSFEEFLETRPHGLKRNLRRYRTKARAVGELRFTVSNNAEPALLRALIDLHRARWRQSGEPGMIDSNRAPGFLRDVANAMAAGDRLRIFALHFEERVAAVILAFRDQSTIFGYLSAFDPELGDWGCGRELLAQALRYAFNEGYRYWDFLRGDEPYKFEWGAQPVPKCRLILERTVTMDYAVPAQT